MNDNAAREPAIADAFNREYGLTDLLKEKDLKDLFSPSTDLFYIEILTTKGRSFFSLERCRIDNIDKRVKALFSDGSFKIQSDVPLDEDIAILPLKYENETIGYFLAAILEDKKPSHRCLKYFANLMTTTLNQMIYLNWMIQMTSGLHCRFVEDSYAELKSKTDLLAHSEKRYRLLAESLEEEVERKTQTIQKALSKLAQHEKMASVGQLAAGVAHEINNPMGFIISNLNTLKNHKEDLLSFFKACQNLISSNEHSRMIENLSIYRDLFEKLDIEYILSDLDAIIIESIEGAERIKKIVMDLKEFSKPGLSDVALADVNHLLETSLRVCQTYIGEDVPIKANLSPLPQTLCHPQEVNQAILNILLNAVQATGKKGEIFIQTQLVGNQIEVSIQDTGCGISQDELPKIFDPFFTTRDVGIGTGLGLTYAYNIMRKHNGTIKVHSKINSGSKFTLRFPVIRS
jgi:signal transduction histidine kinase